MAVGAVDMAAIEIIGGPSRCGGVVQPPSKGFRPDRDWRWATPTSKKVRAETRKKRQCRLDDGKTRN